MKRGVLIFYVTALLVAAAITTATAPAGAQTLGKQLAERLAATEGGFGLIPIIITLKEQANLHTIRAGDSATVCRALQHTARESQRDLLSLLNTKHHGGVTDVESLWGVNAVICSASVDVIEALLRRSDVETISLDGIITQPDEPREETTRDDFGAKGALWNVEKVNAHQVWNELGLTGDGVVIGHIDSGIDGEHPDLAGKVVVFRDYTEGGVITKPYDEGGHGTHTAGTICGGDASGSTIGVAPGTRLLVAKIFSEGQAQESWVLKAMQWMLDPDGNPATDDAPPVVSNSWGSNDVTDRTWCKITEAWVKAGILPCFAAGNNGYMGSNTCATPANYPHCFAVGSTSYNDTLSGFSSRGPTTWDGITFINPQVSAPGHQVTSARAGGGYVKLSGTSMACPAVAGVVALLAQAKPDITPEEVTAVLVSTARDLGTSGNDNHFGYGLTDALAACRALETGGTLLGRAAGPDGKAVRTSITVRGSSQTFDTGGSGRFSIFLKAGSYTLKAESFGFQTFEKRITIRAGSTNRLNIRFKEAKKFEVHGTVSGSDSRDLPAHVKVLGENLPETFADDIGRYSLKLPAGKHTLRFFHTGYGTVDIEVQLSNSDYRLDITMETLPPILLVDDDRYDDFERFYKQEIMDAGYTFTYIENPPDMLTMLQYPLTIWFTGDDSYLTLKEDDRKTIDAYLAGGGSLLLTGQNIGYDLMRETWVKETLRAEFMMDNAKSERVNGTSAPFDGMTFIGITGEAPDVDQEKPDWIDPINGSVTCLEYDNGRSAAVRFENNTARLIFMGFGIEGIDNRRIRIQLMKRACDWLLPAPGMNLRRILAALEQAGDPETAHLYLRSARARIIAELDRALANGDCETIEQWTHAVRDLAAETGCGYNGKAVRRLHRILSTVGQWSEAATQRLDAAQRCDGCDGGFLADAPEQAELIRSSEALRTTLQALKREVMLLRMVN